jgi:hypothetical protein
MGRPLNKRFFGPLSGTTGTPSGDGRDQHGTDITGGSYSNKQKGYNIPVYKARIPGGTLASPTYAMDVGGDAGNLPYILAQKGSRKYRVRTADGDGNCVLVNDDGSSAVGPGEMVIAGFLSSDSGAGSPIFIKKLTKFFAVDFSNNRYTWYVDNDGSSVGNVLVLTAV